jgi:thymidylate kinase
MYGKLNQKKAVEELMDSYKRFELAKEEYEREKSKYLRFEKFERPTTLESETSKYNLFLEKVRENYLLFNDVNKINGTKPVDLVFEDIKRAVKERLRL